MNHVSLDMLQYGAILFYVLIFTLTLFRKKNSIFLIVLFMCLKKILVSVKVLGKVLVSYLKYVVFLYFNSNTFSLN